MTDTALPSRPTAFLAQQAAARQRTGRLLALYFAGIAAIVFAVYCAIRLVADFIIKPEEPGGTLPFIYGPLLLWTTLGTLAVIAVGSLWRIMELRSGGRAVAEMMGGTLVGPAPREPALQQLRNVVEEMAIASGVPVPEIYVLDSQRSINAFAAGYSPADAAVAVTRGCLKHLTRDELQGVIAHEFSHILNGDMRLNIHLLGLLNGLLAIYLAGRVLLEVRCDDLRDRKAGGVVVLLILGALLVAIGYLGILMGRIIQAAVSRQREFLADASAVQFTRNPDGLGGALKKIGGCSAGSRIVSAQSEAVSHLYFSNGITDPWFDWMATHPPLADRIRRLDPSFTGKFPRLAEDTVIISESRVRQAQPTPLGIPVIRPAELTRSVGTSIPVQYAAGIINALPPSLRVATQSTWSATALMYAMILSSDLQWRETQVRRLSSANSSLAADAQAFARALQSCDRRARLPLLTLALPALRQMSRQQWANVAAMLDQLVTCDSQVDLFEFALKKITERNVEAHFAGRDRAVVQYYSFSPLADEFSILLSAIASCGNESTEAVRTAFTRGAARLPMFAALRWFPASHCGIDKVDQALSRIAEAAPQIKMKLLEACAEIVAADGFINAHEAEFLRAIAEALSVPIPPVIRGV